MPRIVAFKPKIKGTFVCCLQIASDYPPELASAASSQQDERDTIKLAHRDRKRCFVPFPREGRGIAFIINNASNYFLLTASLLLFYEIKVITRKFG